MAFGSAMFAATAALGQLRFALHDEPKTLDPFLAADESAEAVRYLTEGVLIRMNRMTQKPDPELAVTHIWAEGTSDVEARRLVAIHAGHVAELTR